MSTRKSLEKFTLLAILALLLANCSTRSKSQPPTPTSKPSGLDIESETIARIDARLAQMTQDGTFTGSVLIALDGKILLSKGYGLSDRVRGIANTPQTRFRLGSVTKRFTAMGILILQSQGKLSVKDPICNFIADCPREWQGITIHHLLTHTSGLSSQLWPIMVDAASSPAAQAQPVPLLTFFPDLPLDFQPGEQFAYSNPGYILLAYIIEQVSGQSYPAFLEKSIFSPLQMHNTGFEDKPGETADGYADSNARLAESIEKLPLSNGAGQLLSTAEDLFLWDQALYTEQLLPRIQLEQMFKRYVRVSSYPGFGYGYGWFVGDFQGHPVVGHSGDDQGFTSLIIRFPEDRLTGILLVNQGDIEPIPLWMTFYSDLFREE